MTGVVKIGVEIHCQLTGLKTKLFCKCKGDYRNDPPNRNVCPICTGQPGTLPLLNSKAIDHSCMIALAMSCTIPSEMGFYRKNYFYPDLPKNYQITQYDSGGMSSVGSNGKLEFGKEYARIRRIQLEEDPGRLIYEGGDMDTSFYTLVDYNRAGTALVEIVTEPDFKDAVTVRAFLNKLTSILEHLGVCNTKLEGSVRCDANISIDNGKRVEIKNVGSFREVEKALNFEITRQESLSSRNIEIKSETRHWDNERKVTKQSRAKEEEEDYKYFLEPDIPIVLLDKRYLGSIQQIMPELPDRRRIRFVEEYQLSDHVSQVLINNKEMADFFEAAVQIYFSPKEISNWLVSDMMSYVGISRNDENVLTDLRIGPRHIADLAKLVDENLISRHTAKSMLNRIMRTGEMPSQIVNQSNSSKIIDEKILTKAIEDAFDSERAAVIDASSNPGVVNFLLGKVLKLTEGRADPKIALSLIRDKLNKID
ncbi:MAG TPA: Asp-tRNA(Asn)/Glu-tRNA(Gln) amidotransferase subunit GatB [Nitrososphaeraceae archaeon]